MMQMVEAWWPLFLIALVLGIAIAWWLFSSTRHTRVTERDSTDVLDEGAAPAARNQALIDAAPAATPQPPVVPAGVAGAGTAVAAAVEAQQVKAAEEAVMAEQEDTSPPLSPAPVPAPVAPPASGSADDLTRIKGVGPKLAELLASLGVHSFAQIADWTDADIDRIDAQLGRFEGRIRRDSWVEQATLLARDDTVAYEARFGRL